MGVDPLPAPDLDGMPEGTRWASMEVTIMADPEVDEEAFKRAVSEVVDAARAKARSGVDATLSAEWQTGVK